MESIIKNRSNRSYKYEAIKATGIVIGLKDVVSAEHWRDLLTKQVNDIAFYDQLRDFERNEKNKIILGDITFKIHRVRTLSTANKYTDNIVSTAVLMFELIVNDFSFTYSYEQSIDQHNSMYDNNEMIALCQHFLYRAVVCKPNLQLIAHTLFAEAF